MNKITGMIVGGILIVIVVVAILMSTIFRPAESPTRATTGEGFMEVLKVNAKLTDIVKAAPSGSGDAGDHYARAVKLFLPNKDLITDSAASLGQGDAREYAGALKVLEEIRTHVSEGAKQAGMNYLARHALDKLAVSKRQKDVQRLDQAIDALDILGDYYMNTKRVEDARAVYRDMFIAGWHMIEEHSQMQMTQYGAVLQLKALKRMLQSIESGLDSDTEYERKAPLNNYRNAVKDFLLRYKEKAKIFRKSRFDAGDIWNIAENDKDRMWRVQAILAAGLIKFTHKEGSNPSRNNAIIERFLNSKDPLEQAAAQAAKAYTEVDFNVVNSTW